MHSQDTVAGNSSDDRQRRRLSVNSAKTNKEDIRSLITLNPELTEYLERKESDEYKEYPGVERSVYDFTAERQNSNSTNLIESTAHLIKGCLGAGVMGIHEGYMHGGLWTSLAANILLGVVVSQCMWMLVRSAQKMYVRLRVPRLSYPDLVEAAVATGPIKKFRSCSKTLRYLMETLLFLIFNGNCCIFQLMMAASLKKVLENVLESVQEWDLSIRIYLLVITLPLVAICSIRSIKYLAPFCIIADTFIAVCVIYTMGFSISQARSISERPAWKSFEGLLRFCGFCIYSIDGVGISLPIENYMDRPQYFSSVRHWAMSLVVPFVMIVGFFGYWAWGEDCRSPITNHLSNSVRASITQSLIILSLGVTFAVHFWVPFKIIWHYLGKTLHKNRGVWERFYRVCHVLVLTLVATISPHVGRWIQFIGCFLSPFMILFFPAFIELFVMWSEPRDIYFKWLILKDASFILFGLMMSIGTFFLYV